MRLLQGLIWLTPLWGVINPGHAAGPALLELEATIPMPGVKGRIDHFAIDTRRERLFVAALGNDTAEAEMGFAEVHFETGREMEEFVKTVGWAVGPDEVEQA